MGNDVTFIIMHGENLGWKVRERFGVYEVAFDSLRARAGHYFHAPLQQIEALPLLRIHFAVFGSFRIA